MTGQTGCQQGGETRHASDNPQVVRCHQHRACAADEGQREQREQRRRAGNAQFGDQLQKKIVSVFEAVGVAKKPRQEQR